MATKNGTPADGRKLNVCLSCEDCNAKRDFSIQIYTGDSEACIIRRMAAEIGWHVSPDLCMNCYHLRQKRKTVPAPEPENPLQLLLDLV